MTSGEVRTRFGARPGQRLAATVVTLVGFALLCATVLIVMGIGITMRLVPALVLLGLVGALLSVVGLSMIWTWGPQYLLTIESSGISLRSRGRTASIPWVDIASWSVEVPDDAAARRVRRAMVLAKPASHVTEPGAGSLRILWVRRLGRWVICQPAQLDASADEIASAMERYAASKQDARTG